MQVLIDTKKEYIKCTQSVLSIPIAEKINNLYELSVADSSGLKGFQNRLNKISQWNNLTIANEYKRIKKNSKYKNIEQIYNTIININIQIKLGDYLNDINNLNISYTSFQDFIHLCYVNVSIWVWKNPYLFFKHNLKQTEIQFNYNLIEKNINKIIKHTITEVTPIDTIMEKLEEYKKPLTTKIFSKFNNFITKNKYKNDNLQKETKDDDLNYNERDYQVINNNTIEKSDDESYLNEDESIVNNGIESCENNNDEDSYRDVIENNASESDNDIDNRVDASDNNIGKDNDASESDNDIDNKNDASENDISNENDADVSDTDIDNINNASKNDISNENDVDVSDKDIDNRNDAGESDNKIDNENDNKIDNENDNKIDNENDNKIDNENDMGNSDNEIDNSGNGNYEIKNKFLSDTDNISSDNSDASSSSSENSNKKIYIKTRKKMY